MSSRPSTPVLVFAKAPDPGRVKTRLIPALGEGGAAVLAARLARRTLDTATRAAVGPVTLVCAPDTGHVFFDVCRRRHGVALAPQGDGDLGQRMHRALARTLDDADTAILVGTDLPDLHVDDLVAARDALHGGADVVLGPATDGGYWLIGVRRAVPTLFDGIEWSTATVLAATRARIARLGWTTHDLALKSDIDRPDDLHALERDPATAPLVGDLLARVRAMGAA